MCAAENGHSTIASMLLDKGSDVSIMADEGFTALHICAQYGHLAVTKVLVEAGADPRAETLKGFTPLYLAAFYGHSAVMRALLDAGANPDSCLPNGESPLYTAASRGKLAAVRELFRAKANPLLTRSGQMELVPLDGAAGGGHPEVVRELIQQFGIKGCGGDSRGVDALSRAAQEQYMDIMAMLVEAGVVDNGTALFIAVRHGGEASVKFLLQQRQQQGETVKSAYIDARAQFGATPLICSIEAEVRSCSPRVVRLLVDAGADVRRSVRIEDVMGRVVFNDTPLAFTNRRLVEKKTGRKDSTEQQLYGLEGIRRLLLRVQAVYAVSWLWPSSAAPAIGRIAEGNGCAMPTSTAVPILRQRTRERRAPLAALFR